RLKDLGRQADRLRTELTERISRVLSSGWYVLGPEVAAFEEKFADFCGARHCIGVANGTDALELALRALGCGLGSEIATVANAGMYATSAIIALGGRPLFVDIDPVSMTMSPESLDALGRRPKAVVV